jgi:RNA polymerase sigma-70 factor (ECF subfamily)
MQPTAVVVVLPASAGTELVLRAANGDVGAFEQLVIAGTERAYRTARAILGNDADAHDATQEAFLATWRELPRLRDPESFDGWHRRILLNACRGRLRDRHHVREISLDVNPIERGDPAPGIAEVVSDTDLLARAFDRLDADKRAILVLHYLELEPVAAIAGTLGVPAGTVKWRLSEARAALSRALRAEGEARR